MKDVKRLVSRAAREVLAVIVYVGWWAFWLTSKLVASLLSGLMWLFVGYARLRHGQEAAQDLRRSIGESEAHGRAWSKHANARLARRVGWPPKSDSTGGSASS
jgi:hypothetical protein